MKSPFYLTISTHIKELKTRVKLPGGMTHKTAESSAEGETSDVVGEADVEAAVEEVGKSTERRHSTVAIPPTAFRERVSDLSWAQYHAEVH